MNENVPILVVEDESIVSMDIQDRLRRLGYTVAGAASTGRDAIIKAEKLKPALVLMDIQLKGGMDGIEAAEEIRRGHDIPVIFLTAFADTATLARAKLTGPFGYITKPFEEKDLRTSIEIAINNHRMEHALKAERDKAQKYLDIAGVMIVALAADGEITLINRKGCEVLGYDEEGLIGRNWFDTCIPRDARAGAKGTFDKIASGEFEIVAHDENPVVTSSGEERIILWYNSAILDETGAFAGYLSSGEDITERRKAERERENLQAQIVQMQKMDAIGTLAGGIAHDFNNILTTIQGNTELALLKIGPNDELRRKLDQIHMAADRAANLTRQLLIFSRKRPVKIEAVDINETVENMLDMLGRLIGEEIRIETHLADHVPLLRADRTNLEQILLNLVVNARDAMPNGGAIGISTSYAPSLKALGATGDGAGPVKAVCLAVEDNGVGIDKDTVAKIFDPFFTTKGMGKGTGLGLSVVYGICEQHGGWVEVDSEPGRGSTFSIYLPAVTEDKSGAVGEEGSSPNLVGDGERVLIVEDEPAVLDITETVLRAHGYQVFPAASAEEGLRIFDSEKGKLDLIFSDVVLPGMSGLDFIDAVVSRGFGGGILFGSGYTDNKSQWPAICERGYKFLSKPYPLQSLLRSVKEILESTRAETRAEGIGMEDSQLASGRPIIA